MKSGAASTIGSALSPLVSGVANLSGAFSSSALAVNRWGSQYHSALSQVTNGARSVTGALTTAGRVAGSAFTVGLSQTDALTAGRTLAQKILAGLNAGGYRAAGIKAASSLAGGLTAGGSSVTRAAGNLSARARNGFGSGWYTLGHNIAAGIASGLRGGSYLIDNAARAAAWAALQEAKRVLGVRSPSRVFRDQVGKMIPAGIAQGVSAGQGKVSQAVAEQSRVLLQEARGQVAPVMSPMSGGIRTPVAQTRGSVQVTVETPLYLDSREVARATAKQVGRQMLWQSM